MKPGVAGLIRFAREHVSWGTHIFRATGSRDNSACGPLATERCFHPHFGEWHLSQPAASGIEDGIPNRGRYQRDGGFPSSSRRNVPAIEKDNVNYRNLDVEMQ